MVASKEKKEKKVHTCKNIQYTRTEAKIEIKNKQYAQYAQYRQYL